jgi:ABC-type iron transport system FetAB permease component
MLIFGLAEIIFGITYAFTFIVVFIAIYHFQRFGLKGDFFGRSFITVFFVVTLFLLVISGSRMFQLKSLDTSTLFKGLWQKSPSQEFPPGVLTPPKF